MSEQRDSEARGDDPLTCSKCGGCGCRRLYRLLGAAGIPTSERSGQHVAADAHEVVSGVSGQRACLAGRAGAVETEGEGVQGDQDCEYGCAGPCFRLDHWRDRAAYWQQAATNLREQLEARAPAPPQPVASEEDFARVHGQIVLGVLRYGTADYDALARVLTDARALAQYAKERGERG